jgi:hypothetical protein
MPIGTKIKGFVRFAAASVMWPVARGATALLTGFAVLLAIPSGLVLLAMELFRMSDNSQSQSVGEGYDAIDKALIGLATVLGAPAMLTLGAASLVDKASSPILGRSSTMYQGVEDFARGALSDIGIIKERPKKAESPSKPSWFEKAKFEMSTGEDFTGIESSSENRSESSSKVGGNEYSAGNISPDVLRQAQSSIDNALLAGQGIRASNNVESLKEEVDKLHDNFKEYKAILQQTAPEYIATRNLMAKEIISMQNKCDAYLDPKAGLEQKDQGLFKEVSEIKGDIAECMKDMQLDVGSKNAAQQRSSSSMRQMSGR